MSDCIELLGSWLSLEGDNTTFRRLRGHWTLEYWNTQNGNSVTVLHYKTLIFFLCVNDPALTVRFSSQDLYQILSRRVSQHQGSREMPPGEGSLTYQEPTGLFTASLTWKLFPLHKQYVLLNMKVHRETHRVAAEKLREQRQHAIIREMISRKPDFERIAALKAKWAGWMHPAAVDAALADDTADTGAYSHIDEQELDEQLKLALATDPDPEETDRGVDMPLCAEDRGRLVVMSYMRALHITQFHEWLQREVEERILQKQQKLYPLAEQALNSAVEAAHSQGLCDMRAVPRSVEDRMQNAHDTWSQASMQTVRDPAVYNAPVAPSSTDLAAHAVDYTLDSIQYGVWGYEDEDEAGPSGTNVFDYQER